MSLTAGTRFGPYEVVGPIGAGGMGEVYRARDTKLNRDVALKILSEAFASDPERLARFDREAKTLASLNHPNIAQIYGFEESGPIHALVMELVPGENLADRIARGAIPLDEALPIAQQIAEALEAAHELGIIHRDLKPANVRVRRNGTVKVLDFGLAKAPDRKSTTDGESDEVLGFFDDHRSHDDARRDPWDRCLHGARTGEGEVRRPARGHLGLRLCALRNADGAARVCRPRSVRDARQRADQRRGLEHPAVGHAGCRSAPCFVAVCNGVCENDCGILATPTCKFAMRSAHPRPLSALQSVRASPASLLGPLLRLPSWRPSVSP